MAVPKCPQLSGVRRTFCSGISANWWVFWGREGQRKWELFQHDFHQSVLLPALQQNAESVEGVSAVLYCQKQRLLGLYRTYCRNKPLSEALRAEHGVDQAKFFSVSPTEEHLILVLP